ncbi:MAG: hypothetical protein K6G17_09325 [Oscillospiraceae bacterium]|nr:hypothetical protein [Oscillospiraceae bacterium]
MEIAKVLEMQKATKTKLVSAIALLLVAALMMSMSTYAWFVLATKPEVKEIKTTAGANGYLEIALAGTTTVDGITQPGEPNQMVKGSSIVTSTQTVSIANTYWGNIVELGSIYGLENMTLYPSRLNLSTGLENTVLVDSPLLVPSFGTDGRITTMRGVQKASYNPQTETYGLDTNYGVHLLGFFNDGESADEENTIHYNRQEIVDTMSGYVYSSRESIRDDVVDLMEDHSRDMFRLLNEMWFYYGGDSVYPLGIDALSSDTKVAIGQIVEGLYDITGDALDSLRYAVVARCAADTLHYPDTEEGNAALGLVLAGLSEMTTDGMALIAQENGYQEITDAVNAINNIRNKLSDAMDYVDGENTQVISAAVLLFDFSSISIGGYSGAAAFQGLAEMAGSAEHTSEMKLWLNSGNIKVFPGMATIVGDYQADLNAYVDYSEIKNEAKYADTETIYDTAAGEGTYAFFYDNMIAPLAGNYSMPMKATGSTSENGYDPSTNIGALAVVYNVASTATVTGDIVITNTVTAKKTAYGYSLDLAFKSSEAGNLKLQQVAADRASGYTQEDINGGLGYGSIMGAGSTMTFTAAADIVNVAALMEGIYVVFMDTKEGTIYALATVDPNQVTTADGKYTAPLVLYSASITNGIITKGAQVDRILNMQADTTYYVTAIVFLNGDIVNSSMLSSTGAVSLQGALNLQFATSATLDAMKYTDFIQGNS